MNLLKYVGFFTRLFVVCWTTMVDYTWLVYGHVLFHIQSGHIQRTE